MLFNFQKHTQHASEFLKEVCMELGTEDTGHGGRVLTAVMHSLRDMITPEESLQMIAQLPLYIRAVYIDGWKIGSKPKRLKKAEDFLSDIQNQTRLTADGDFGDLENTRTEVEAVFRVLKRHIDKGEIEDIKSQLSEEICNLLDQKV